MDFAARTGVDGFNIAYHITPGSFVDVAEYLIPELRRRGLAGGDQADTLRQRLFPSGSALLPDEHPGAAPRKRISAIR